jgi:hypothetical protein
MKNVIPKSSLIDFNFISLDTSEPIFSPQLIYPIIY